MLAVPLILRLVGGRKGAEEGEAEDDVRWVAWEKDESLRCAIPGRKIRNGGLLGLGCQRHGHLEKRL